MNSNLYPEIFATALLFLGVWVVFPKSAWSRTSVRLLVVLLFQLLNLRYISWRLQETVLPLSLDPEALWNWAFLGMEMCATLVLAWHFFLLIKPSDRRPEADEAERRLRSKDSLPGVDVLIPTYNEPEDILRRTIHAATSLDYPNYEVWVLDDGARKWLEDFCRERSVSYVVRPDRKAFKAGNLNHAIGITQNPLICVVDADFALKPNFLMRTVGLMDDPEIGIVQTPQIFSNPDAIQYNLGGEKAWPEAQCMFTDVMQSSRDQWGNAFCYGTGFLIKRKCLELCGGIPEETISEDLHTTYTLLSHGFKTRFLNEELCTGLATQDIGEFVNQRTRWGVGTLQCLFARGGVLRAKGLSLIDRLFFLDPVLYHIGAVWTFCMLIAPALYWWFGAAPFHTDFAHLLVVSGPRMLLSIFGLYVLSNRKTLPFVTEVGRVAGLFYFLRGVINLIANPRSQVFKVTQKQLDLTKPVIYWRIMMPHLAILILTLSGMAFNFLGAGSEIVFMRRDIGLMIALSLYTIWLLFFTCLVCVQRPIPEGQLHTVDTLRIGSVRATLRVLFARVMQLQ